MTKATVKKAAPRLIRQINRASILEIIKNEGPISRAEIARRTKFSKVTVSSIMRNLLEEHLVREELTRTSLRGVNPILYSLNRKDNFTGAISIDSTHTTIAIVNIESKIIAQDTFPTLTNNSEKFINHCIDRLEGLKQKTNTQKLVGIGVSIPGTLNFQRTELVHSIDLDWHHVPLMEILKGRIKEQVVIENDTRCAALAEWTFSPNQAIRDADIFIFIEYGVACNFKFDNRLCTGRHNLAGEFGHFIINSADEADEFDNIGYLKNYLSNRATVQYYNQLTKESHNGNIDQEMEWILRQVRMQQPEAVQTISRFIKYLAIGIANMINFFDPNGIIIYSKINKIWDIVHEDLMKNILKYTLHRDEELFSLYPSSLNDEAPIIGAATLILRHLFKYPRLPL
ncbi:MAG: ROK family transcriptional regulator [Calditrichaeota bacterium]|nr:ROK family transcriptional regulator [Calditrichota bacterium]